jgi:MFS family permease
MKRDVSSNTLTYFIYRALLGSSMRGPLLVLFMTQYCKMPLSEVYLCEACCVVVLVILQIPMGILADRWGRARVVRIGSVIMFAELVVFTCSKEHIMLWIGNMLWAIGTSMISGADNALFYDSLKQNIKNEVELESTSRIIEGRSRSVGMVASAIMCLSSGFVAGVDIRIPFVIDSILALGAVTASLRFVEPEIHTEKESKIEFWSQITDIIKQVMSGGQILWVIMFATLIGVSSKLWFFTYNPYFDMVGVDIKYVGVIFFTLNMIAAISSHYANTIAKYIDNEYGIIISISLLTVPMIAMGLLVSKWAVIMVLFQNFIRGYLEPFTTNMINKRVEYSNRATVMSVKGAIYQAMEVVCMALFSGLIHYATLGHALVWLGVVASAFGLVLTYYYVKLFRK